MGQVASRQPSGHVFCVERMRGAVWYAKYRLPDGRQVQKRIGPSWSEQGCPAQGYFTQRLAEEWLREVLDQARRGTLPGMARTGATFADAASEFLRYAEQDRNLRPSTLRGYRSILDAYLLPTFGCRGIEDITKADVELWWSNLTGVGGGGGTRKHPSSEDRAARGRAPTTLSNNSKNRILTLLNRVFGRACKVYGLPMNPVSGIERHAVKRVGDIEVFSPEEIFALVRAAASSRDGAIYLTAAFTGLRRGELIALRWRDVDFAGSVLRVSASYAGGVLTTPKSGKMRSVPLAPDVAQTLARLADRELFTAEDDLVFPGALGEFLDGSALRRRYNAALGRAGLRSLRFDDLRHTFGTRMIAKADIRRVQEWMGHADLQTTMRYLHHEPREEDARLVAEAFRVETPGAQAQAQLGRP
jgi:integrase